MNRFSSLGVLAAIVVVTLGCSSASSQRRDAASTSSPPTTKPVSKTPHFRRPLPKAMLPPKTTATSTLPTTPTPQTSVIAPIHALAPPATPSPTTTPPATAPPTTQPPATRADFKVWIMTIPYPFWVHTDHCPPGAQCSTIPPSSVDITVELDSYRFSVFETRDITVPMPGSVGLTFNEQGLTLRYRVTCTTKDPDVCQVA